MRILVGFATALSITLVILVRAAAQQTPACDDAEQFNRTWVSAWGALGVSPARDDRPLGDLAAERWFGSGNWYPIDGTNQTMCGTLRDWSVYNGAPVTPHELDVHPYLTPSRDFDYLVTDLPAASRQNTHLCRVGSAQAPCVWGEVTTVPSIGQWLLGDTFPRDIKKPYKDHAACVFGPWVMERVHGWRSEIHPYRQFWATESPLNSATVDLVLVQDSSDRYGTQSQYSMIGPRSGSPWSSRSVDETVGVAYELADGASATLVLTEQRTFGVTAGNGQTNITHQFGNRSVNIQAPGWIRAASDEACSAVQDGTTVVRGIDWLTVRVDPPETAMPFESAATVLRLARSGTATVPPVEPLRRTLRPALLRESVAQPLRRSQEAELPPATAEPILRLDLMSVAPADEEIRDAQLERTSRAWQLTSEDAQTWRVSPGARIRFRPYYTGTTPRAEDTANRLNKEMEQGRGPTITIAWRFTADGWDNAPRTRIGVAQSEDRYYYGVRTFGGDGIRTVVSKGFQRNALAMSGEERWRAELAIASPTSVLQQALPLSAVIHITATLRDSEGRVSSRPFQFDFYSHLPQIADIHARHDPPPTFLAFVARWLAKQRLDLKIDAAEIGAALAADSDQGSGDAVHANGARRRAHIFRLSYLISAQADYLAADDLAEILRLAKAWVDARWPPAVNR